MMIRFKGKKEKVGQVAQMDNQFKHWNTDELRQWVEDAKRASLLNNMNLKAYHEAIKELSDRTKDYDYYAEHYYYKYINKNGTPKDFKKWLLETEEMCDLMCP